MASGYDMFYVILSAFLYVIGLLNPAYCLLTLMTFLMPLYLIKQTKQYRAGFVKGLVWGIIVFGVLWWWLLVLLMKFVWLWGFLFWIVLVLWFSCLSGVWFCFFAQSPICSSVIFFIVIAKYCMFLSGAVAGYPLCNPLVCLAYFPWTLHWLYWLSDVGTLILIFAGQIALVDLCKNKSLRSVCIFILCMAMMILGYCRTATTDKKIPETMITVCPWWYGQGDAMFAGYRMSHDICLALQRHRDATIVVMPESSFCWDIQEYTSFTSIWCDSAGDTPILFGAHQNKNAFPHNAVFLLHNNEFKFCYRKQHAMPMVERSIWIESLLGRSLLGGPLRSFISSDDQDVLTIDSKTYQIFICSEFFFESKPTKGLPILLLWNDWWLQCDYAKQLAVLFIKYFEKKYRVPVLHVSTGGITNIIQRD